MYPAVLRGALTAGPEGIRVVEIPNHGFAGPHDQHHNRPSLVFILGVFVGGIWTNWATAKALSRAGPGADDAAGEQE
jgi:hypothetical protein